MVDTSKRFLFEEEQSIRQPWVWILTLLTSAAVIVMFTHALYQQLHLGKPWGTNPASDNMLLVFAVLGFVLAIGLPLLLLGTRLIVRVDRTHLHIRYRPFFRQSIQLEQIMRFEPCTYRPLRDYGGWGIRIWLFGKGWAYNVSGNRGVQLELSGGKRLLIGSQQPDALAKAIQESKNA
jgi:hypothetical protein